MKKKLTESDISYITSSMLGTEEVQEAIWATYGADSEIDDDAIESILDRLDKVIKAELRKPLA